MPLQVAITSTNMGPSRVIGFRQIAAARGGSPECAYRAACSYLPAWKTCLNPLTDTSCHALVFVGAKPQTERSLQCCAQSVRLNQGRKQYSPSSHIGPDSRCEQAPRECRRHSNPPESKRPSGLIRYFVHQRYPAPGMPLLSPDNWSRRRMSACRGGGTARPLRGARKRGDISSHSTLRCFITQHLEMFHHSTELWPEVGDGVTG